MFRTTIQKRNANSEGSTSGQTTIQKGKMRIRRVVYPVGLRFKKEKYDFRGQYVQPDYDSKRQNVNTEGSIPAQTTIQIVKISIPRVQSLAGLPFKSRKVLSQSYNSRHLGDSSVKNPAASYGASNWKRSRAAGYLYPKGTHPRGKSTFHFRGRKMCDTDTQCRQMDRKPCLLGLFLAEVTTAAFNHANINPKVIHPNFSKI